MKKKQSFDDSLKLLEEIVEKMETQELPLEEALKLYKEGAKLSAFCKEKLTSVEGEILIIKNEQNDKGEEKWLKENFLEGD